jgi:predicted Fe-Mo cluster-binding NifX family protein
MRIAVTAQGAHLESEIDPRFGRARYILIADGEGNLLEVLDNSAGVNSLRGAGIQAGKLLSDQKVDVLLTGNCGPNAFKALQAAKIKVATDQTGTVREAIERFKKGRVTYAESPNVEGHW